MRRASWKYKSSIWERYSSKSRCGNTRSFLISRAENGGFDEGMTPPELLLASLGSCAAYYAAEYLRQHKLATEGTKVRVMRRKGEESGEDG